MLARAGDVIAARPQQRLLTWYRIVTTTKQRLARYDHRRWPAANIDNNGASHVFNDYKGAQFKAE